MEPSHPFFTPETHRLTSVQYLSPDPVAFDPFREVRKGLYKCSISKAPYGDREKERDIARACRFDREKFQTFLKRRPAWDRLEEPVPVSYLQAIHCSGERLDRAHGKDLAALAAHTAKPTPLPISFYSFYLVSRRYRTRFLFPISVRSEAEAAQYILHTYPLEWARQTALSARKLEVSPYRFYEFVHLPESEQSTLQIKVIRNTLTPKLDFADGYLSRGWSRKEEQLIYPLQS